MTVKLISFWILGGLSMLFGFFITNNLKYEIGVTDLGFVLALVVALVLILIAGLFWISVAVASKQ